MNHITARRATLGVVGLALAVTGMTLATTGEADAAQPHRNATPRCMTKKEWRKVQEGQTRQQVKKITGIWGKVTYETDFGDGTHSWSVDYQQCQKNGRRAPGSWNVVTVEFNDYDYDYDYNEVSTPMQVEWKGAWSTVVVF